MFQTIINHYGNNIRIADVGDIVYYPINFSHTPSQDIIIRCNIIARHVYYDNHNIYDQNGPLDYPNICEIFYDIDEPIGNSLCLGYTIFETLDEARKNIRPSSKKHLSRRLRKARYDRASFIASTWGNKTLSRNNLVRIFKDKNPEFFKHKKVYVK